MAGQGTAGVLYFGGLRGLQRLNSRRTEDKHVETAMYSSVQTAGRVAIPISLVTDIPQLAPPVSRTRVLVVEDDLVVALQLRLALLRQGYGQVEVAMSGEEALIAMEREFPDVVVLEVALPNDGPGPERHWRLPKYVNLPVVYVAGRRADGGEAAAVRGGALQRPFLDGQIHASVQMALVHKRAEMAVRNHSAMLFRRMEASAVGQC